MGLADKFAKSTKLYGAGKFSKILEKEKKLHDTGVYGLNLAFSGDLLNGGLNQGVTCLAGKSKSFKTLFGLIACKAYLDAYPDAHMIFYDSEGGASQEYFESVGIDVERVIYVPVMNVEELKFDLVTKLEDIRAEYESAKKEEDKPRFVVFVDSIGNLASIKEVRDAMSDNPAADMGTRAKALKAFFRIATPYFDRCEMSMIGTMHTYDDMGSMGAPKQIMSGGCLLPGTRILTAQGSYKNIEDIEVGEFVATKNGMKEVHQTWNPKTLENGNPQCISVEFEDGFIVECSENHKFLVNDQWVEAKDLKPGDDAQIKAKKGAK